MRAFTAAALTGDAAPAAARLAISRAQARAVQCGAGAPLDAIALDASYRATAEHVCVPEGPARSGDEGQPCASVASALCAAAAGELAPEDGERLRRHLAACRTCRATSERFGTAASAFAAALAADAATDPGSSPWTPKTGEWLAPGITPALAGYEAGHRADEWLPTTATSGTDGFPAPKQPPGAPWPRRIAATALVLAACAGGATAIARLVGDESSAPVPAVVPAALPIAAAATPGPAPKATATATAARTRAAHRAAARRRADRRAAARRRAARAAARRRRARAQAVAAPASTPARPSTVVRTPAPIPAAPPVRSTPAPARTPAQSAPKTTTSAPADPAGAAPSAEPGRGAPSAG